MSGLHTIDTNRKSRARSPKVLALWLALGLIAALVPAISVAPLAAEAQSIDVYGPAPFVDILDSTMPATATPGAIGDVVNRAHVMLLDAETKSSVLTIDSPGSGNLGVTNVASMLGGGGTYGDALSSMFQMLDKNAEILASAAESGTYTFQPELLSYYSIDAAADAGSSSSTSVALRDRGSFYLTDQPTIAYLVFTITDEATPESTTIQATERYHYVGGSFQQDPAWSPDHWLHMSSTSVSLTTVEADATDFFLADALDVIDFGLDAGSDFNPASIEWQTNSFAAFPGGEWDYFDSRLTNELLLDLDSYYHDQLGNSASSAAAASAALDDIATSLQVRGESMRYDKSVYLAYRDNALSHLFGAHDVYNARLGERTVAHVYFVNAQDDAGVYHPFMVIASHDASGGPNFLIDVPRPPGDGNGGTYETQTITRRAILENKLVKIPLKDYGLVDDLVDNDLAALGLATLASDMGLPESEWTALNHTGNASTGIAADGVVIYPASNNQLVLATEVAEVTTTGIHVGRGLGLHYHADGHGYNGNGLNLYNAADYVGRDHPPLIGFAYDGVALFGKYDPALGGHAGAGVALDEYGGHDHGGYGYHYHAFSDEVTPASRPGQPAASPYTQHFLLVGSWRGDVNSIPAFGEVSDAQLKSDTAKRYVGGEAPTIDPGVSFDDVLPAAYYAEAVSWAAANGITTGTSATTFSPDDPVTRAQMATFLWRYAGTPPGGPHGFIDVPDGLYYSDPVKWLAQSGITTGTTPTTYSPDDPVTRAQMATFLWRYEGSPAAAPSAFTDVGAGLYYSTAVGWMSANGITTGTSATTFSPFLTLTRAQAVTFLWRLAGSP